MKRFFFTLFLIAGVTLTYANTSNTGLSYDGPWLSMFDSIVINEDSLQFVTITMNDENKRSLFDCWSISGDLKVNPDYSPNATSIQISSHGPGKGRLTYIYNQVGCGSMSVGINIYKRFNPNLQPYNIEISGPDCILEGDTVVFSIDPILTKNLTQGIGVDEYFWTFTPGLVQEHIYKAGDNSSVTFVAGAVTGNDSIKVQVGIANASDPVSKTLGKAAPKPTINPICVPYGIADVQVSVAEPVENVMYSWTCNDDEWGFKPQIGSEVTLIPGNTSSPIITVTAYYEGGEACRASQTTMKVSRSWANNVSVESDTVPYRFGNEYNFTVTGGATGGGLSWTPPAGWKVIYKDGKEVIMKPDTADKVKLHDSLFVEAALTCAEPGVDRRRYDVYVKPAKVTEITDNGCLIVDTTYKFKITDWEAGPKASTYKWLVDGIEQNSYEGDSLVWKAVSGTQTISVIPRGAMYDGEHYYWGDTATFTLTFKPTPPDAIVCPDCECISVNMPDTIKFYVTNDLNNTQTYSWTYTQGLTLHRQNNDTIELITNGTPNAKDTVWVKAVQDNQDCPQSNSIYKAITIHTTNSRFIDYDAEDGGNTRVAYHRLPNGIRTEAGDAFLWYLLYNQQIVANAITYPTDRTIFIEDNPLLVDKWGDTELPSGYVIVCEYTPTDSCYSVRLTFPENALPSNFTPSDTIFISQLPNLTPNMSPRREEISKGIKAESLQLYPNPTDHTLQLSLQDNSNFNIRIVTMDGDPVYISNDSLKQYDVNVSSLPQGKYLVTAFKDGRRIASEIFFKK